MQRTRARGIGSMKVEGRFWYKMGDPGRTHGGAAGQIREGSGGGGAGRMCEPCSDLGEQFRDTDRPA